MEYDPVYGYDLDYKYNDLSTENEQQIQDMKSSYRSVVTDLVTQINEFDSPNFCSKVVKDSLTSGETYIAEAVNTHIFVKSTLAYQSLIETVYKACNAARLGRIDILRNLDAVHTMNFNLGDYDGRTPLYYAVRNYQTNTVLYLIDEWGVQINKKDRYGAHPVDYVGYNSKMEKVLYARGAKRTTVKNPIQLQPIAVNKYTMKENEVRLFWAVYYGDLETVQILDNIGVNLKMKDFDSRTPLHIAASEGQVDVAKYLLNRGAEIAAMDARNNMPKNDSMREGRTAILDLINSVQSTNIVNAQCKLFANGVFQNGMAQAIGAYHKKFQDLQIFMNSTNNYISRLTLIYGERFNASKVLAANEIFQTKVIDLIVFRFTSTKQLLSSNIPEFVQSVELFIQRVVAQTTQEIKSTYASTFNQYSSQSQIIYACYLVFQLLILLIMRKKMIVQMRNDIFESRGILNLIPNHFFENNKQIVEGIMKKLKY